MCENLMDEQGSMPIVFAGGVMCNSIIKAKLKEKFDARFAEPMLSADNAVGIAELTRLLHTK
jgi:N6-L-threonylcarbamoyladenine synthase